MNALIPETLSTPLTTGMHLARQTRLDADRAWQRLLALTGSAMLVYLVTRIGFALAAMAGAA